MIGSSSGLRLVRVTAPRGGARPHHRGGDNDGAPVMFPAMSYAADDGADVPDVGPDVGTGRRRCGQPLLMNSCTSTVATSLTLSTGPACGASTSWSASVTSNEEVTTSTPDSDSEASSGTV